MWSQYVLGPAPRVWRGRGHGSQVRAAIRTRSAADLPVPVLDVPSRTLARRVVRRGCTLEGLLVDEDRRRGVERDHGDLVGQDLRDLLVLREPCLRVEVRIALLDQGVDLGVAVALVVRSAQVPRCVEALVDRVPVRRIDAAERPAVLADVEVSRRQERAEEARGIVVRRVELDPDRHQLLGEDRATLLTRLPGGGVEPELGLLTAAGPHAVVARARRRRAAGAPVLLQERDGALRVVVVLREERVLAVGG